MFFNYHHLAGSYLRCFLDPESNRNNLRCAQIFLLDLLFRKNPYIMFFSDDNFPRINFLSWISTAGGACFFEKRFKAPKTLCACNGSPDAMFVVPVFLTV